MMHWLCITRQGKIRPRRSHRESLGSRSRRMRSSAALLPRPGGAFGILLCTGLALYQFAGGLLSCFFSGLFLGSSWSVMGGPRGNDL